MYVYMYREREHCKRHPSGRLRVYEILEIVTFTITMRILFFACLQQSVVDINKNHPPRLFSYASIITNGDYMA